MPTKFHAATPLLPAGASLDEALGLYCGQLGFALRWRQGDMAGIGRDGVAFNLVVNSERAWADNASCAIAVADLDALYAEYAGVAARIGALEIKPWGRREFHMILPSGVCLQFHQGE